MDITPQPTDTTYIFPWDDEYDPFYDDYDEFEEDEPIYDPVYDEIEAGDEVF